MKKSYEYAQRRVGLRIKRLINRGFGLISSVSFFIGLDRLIHENPLFVDNALVPILLTSAGFVCAGISLLNEGAARQSPTPQKAVVNNLTHINLYVEGTAQPNKDGRPPKGSLFSLRI